MMGMQSSSTHHPSAPTICVHSRKLPSVMHLLAALLLFTIALWCGQRGTMASWFTTLVALGSLGYAVVATSMLLDRKPRLVFRHDAVDVVTCRTGPIRYHEIVHVECFRVQTQTAVAIFVAPEVHARLPPISAASRTPVFASELFAGPPIWFADGALDATAQDIAAELDARRRGTTGPLTARTLSRR